MQSPSREQRICEMFDSFCKKVSRNYVRNLDRAEKNRKKHYTEEPLDAFLEIIRSDDVYPSDSFSFEVAGYYCVVEDETMYKALMSLPEKYRAVLVMDYWHGCMDGEIAIRLNVSLRTICNWRRSAKRKIYEYYEKWGQGP